MGIFGFRQTYFSLSDFDPLARLDRLLNPFTHHTRVSLNQRPVQIQWTKRAARQLANRSSPLIVEMQLYFSCVVKKRVLFHQQSDLDLVAVNDQLSIAFRPVQPTACDPVEFANNFPVKQVLASPGAQKMHPRQLQLDFHRGQWQAEFFI